MAATAAAIAADAGMPVMNAATLRAIARKDGLYSTPALNDVLYLHMKGFRAIGGLEEYTGLKVLWLGQNAISAIEGLGALASLTTLLLNDNAIDEIAGLEGCPKLDTLNLAHNMIDRISGLSSLTNLRVRGRGPQVH